MVGDYDPFHETTFKYIAELVVDMLHSNGTVIRDENSRFLGHAHPELKPKIAIEHP